MRLQKDGLKGRKRERMGIGGELNGIKDTRDQNIFLHLYR